MKKWIVRIVDTDTGRVRNETVLVDTKKQAIDKVLTKEFEYVAFCCTESEE